MGIPDLILLFLLFLAARLAWRTWRQEGGCSCAATTGSCKSGCAGCPHAGKCKK